MAIVDPIGELIAAAAVCAGDRDVSRRLAKAIAVCAPDLASDAEAARKAGARAAPVVIGHGAPPPRTAADRVWCWLDRHHGAAITAAAIGRLWR